MPPPVEVAAGLVFRHGKLLIAQRPTGSHLGGLWEFPGGKREPTETYEACLRRELFEELGIEVQVGRLIEEITHAYPERSVHLRFYACRWLHFEPRPIHCQAATWIEPGDLDRFAFPAADARLVQRLRVEWAAWAASTG